MIRVDPGGFGGTSDESQVARLGEVVDVLCPGNLAESEDAANGTDGK